MCVCVCLGYGFVDFDSPAAAQKAVASLKANGVQAQMAKVRRPMKLHTHNLLVLLIILLLITKKLSQNCIDYDHA